MREETTDRALAYSDFIHEERLSADAAIVVCSYNSSCFKLCLLY